MRVRLRTVLLVVAGLLGTAAVSSPADPDSGQAKASPDAKADKKKDEHPPFRPVQPKFAEGEKLTYSVKWGAVHAGQAVLSVGGKQHLGGADGPEVWKIHCRTRSSAFLSMFYEVRDDIDTYMDAKEGFSRLFDMEKHEGSYHGTERIEFDYGKNQAHYVRTDVNKPDRNRDLNIALPGKVHDPMSCLYYARFLDLKAGEDCKFTVNTSRKNWVMTLKVLYTEKQDIPGLGRISTLVVEPEAQFQGIFQRKGKMTIWLEEESKIPVMMKVKIPIGSATAVLAGAENSPLDKLFKGK